MRSEPSHGVLSRNRAALFHPSFLAPSARRPRGLAPCPASGWGNRVRRWLLAPPPAGAVTGGPTGPGVSSEPHPAPPAPDAAEPGTPGMSGREGVRVARAEEMGESWPVSRSPPPAAPPPRSLNSPSHQPCATIPSPSLSPCCFHCCCSAGPWAVQRTGQVRQGHGGGVIGETCEWHRTRRELAER